MLLHLQILPVVRLDQLVGGHGGLIKLLLEHLVHLLHQVCNLYFLRLLRVSLRDRLEAHMLRELEHIVRRNRVKLLQFTRRLGVDGHGSLEVLAQFAD